jgi:hypothetical protein
MKGHRKGDEYRMTMEKLEHRAVQIKACVEGFSGSILVSVEAKVVDGELILRVQHLTLDNPYHGCTFPFEQGNGEGLCYHEAGSENAPDRKMNGLIFTESRTEVSSNDQRN